jgi:hypothetical protein
MSWTRPSGRPDCNEGLYQRGFPGFESRAFGIEPAVSSTVRALAAALGFAFAAIAMLGASPATAQCSPSGNVENCTGNIPGPRNFDTSSGVNDLEINNVTTGPSQASLRGLERSQAPAGRRGQLLVLNF